MGKQLRAFIDWIDARFPLTLLWKQQVAEYYAPKNLNFWYYFGSFALLVLVMQILTGIFLTMNYKPDANTAFASVEYIMRDVWGGWIIRYMHSTGASLFFVCVYLHMFRGLLYGSYRKPRELLWIIGMLIYLCLMAEAFFGYLLPWGQMSYWGAQVIVNLFDAIPVIGPPLALWIRGDYVVSDATLNRFFAFHVIAIPLALLGLVVAHLIALHEVGSNNPDGVEIKLKKDANGIPLDGIPFHPYYTLKDLVGLHRLLHSGDGRLFSRIQQFHSRGPAAHTAAHRASLVFHAVLLDPAREHDQFLLDRCEDLGRGLHGARRADLLLAAVARSQPGQIDPLSRTDLQNGTDALCHRLPRARLPRHAAGH